MANDKKKMVGQRFDLLIKGVNGKVEKDYNTLTFCKLLRGQKCDGGNWFTYEETNNPKLIGTTKKDKYGNGTITYVDDLEKLMEQDSKISFSAQLVISNKNPMLPKLKAVIKKIATENKLTGGRKQWNNPLMDGEEKILELEEKDKNGDRYKGCHVLKITAKKPIKFYDKNNKAITPKSDDDLDGMFCQLVLWISGYDVGSNKGVSCYINLLQVRDKNPEFDFGVDAEDAFGAEDPEFGDEEIEENIDKADDGDNGEGNIEDDELPISKDDDDDEDPFEKTN